MKKTIYIILFALLATSCESYLDENPDLRLELNTLDKVSELLVTAYPHADYLFTDWMTDDVEYISSNKQQLKMTSAFLWEDMCQYEVENSPTAYWNAAYKAIAHANAALKALETIEGGDKKHKEAIKGEALLCRGYAHFMLVSFFAQNYDKNTASQALGIAYVTEPEEVLIKKYKRKSLEETYALIEKDLLEGMTFLNEDYYTESKKYHFTKEAAYAFACRYYLYKKEYQKSIKYADLILGSNTIDPLKIKDIAEMTSQPGASAMKTYFVESSDASNLLLVEKLVSIGLRYNYGYRTGIKFWRAMYTDDKNIFGTNDLRSSMGYYGDGARATIKEPKFHEEFYKKSLTAKTGEPFYVQSVFRGIEVLYNRAECKLELGNTDGALADLSYAMDVRYEGVGGYILTAEDCMDYEETDNAKEAVMNVLLSERRKEFMQEGMRWLDIKRHNIEITHTTLNGSEIVLEANDKRKVFQIPTTAFLLGLEKNPR